MPGWMHLQGPSPTPSTSLGAPWRTLQAVAHGGGCRVGARSERGPTQLLSVCVWYLCGDVVWPSSSTMYFVTCRASNTKRPLGNGRACPCLGLHGMF